MSISFGGIEGEGLVNKASEIAMSCGSACTKDTSEPSYVLKAIRQTHTPIRIGFGRFTTKEEVMSSVDIIAKDVTELRRNGSNAKAKRVCLCGDDSDG